MLKVYVTTCPQYQFLLPEFKKRMDLYWGKPFTVDIAKEGESWSSQVLRLCDEIDDEYFTLMSEEFFLTEPVNKTKLFYCEKLIREDSPQRVSLQCVADGYRDCSEVYNKVRNIYRLYGRAQYLCSFEASIYQRSFLKGVLQPGLHIWEAEIDASKRGRGDNTKVLVFERPLVTYTDAMRRGKSRIAGIPDAV